MTTPDDQAIRDQTVALMQAYQTLITEQRFDEWIELWADDGVCEFPFAAVALDHGHIYGQCRGLTEAGGDLLYVFDPDPAKARPSRRD